MRQLLIGTVAALLLATGSLLPGIASAETVTIGPALTGTVGVAGGCPTATTTPPADEPYYDCTYVDTSESTDVVAQAPAAGTITSWSVAFWNGTADLVIVKPTSTGDEIVAKSAEETEPCIPESIGFGNTICNPQPGVFTYDTKLPIQAGDYIGIEGISKPGCGAESFNGGQCFMVGFAEGTSRYWNETPGQDTPTPFSNDGGGGENSGIALNAVEEITKTTVAVNLEPDKITADGKATTTATATVTEEGKPLAGKDVSFASSDPGESIGSVSETSEGVYTATITASRTAGEATITATDESDSEHPSGEATLTQEAPKIDVSLDPGKITADGKSTADVKATVTGVEGEPISGEDVSFSTTDSGEKIGAASETGDGVYSATITASHTVGTPTITATDDSDPEHPSADAALTQAAPSIEVSVSPSSIKADGKSTATVTATVKGVDGEGVAGEDVAITTKGPIAEGLVKDEGNGAYTETLTALHSAGKVEITASDISVDPNVSASTNLTTEAPKGKKGVKASKHKHKKHKKKKKKKKKKPKQCKVPKLAGDTLAQAKKALSKAGCGVGKVTTKKSSKVKKGKVISAGAKTGSKHKHGTHVNVVVSAG